MTTDNEHGPMDAHDDAEFALFLQREGELSRQMHGLPQPESPPELDAAILARIGAALAEERAPVAANDAAAPEGGAAPPRPAASPIRSPLRSRWAPWWRVSVGIAAGVLVATVFRMTWQPGQDAQQPQVALLDKAEQAKKSVEETKAINADKASDAVVDHSLRRAAPPPAPEPPPKVAQAQDRVEAPAFARAPATVAPPPVSIAPPMSEAPAASPVSAPTVAMAPQAAPTRQLRAMVQSKPESPAYAAAQPQRQEQNQLQRVEVAGQSARSADVETPSPVQVVASQEVAQSSYGQVDQARKTQSADPVGEASGTELAWPHDPARSALQESPSAHAPAAAPNADLAVADAPKPAPMLASRAAPAEFVPPPAPIVAAPPRPSALPDARTVTAAMQPLGAPTLALEGAPAALRQAADAQTHKLHRSDEEKMRRKPSTWLTLIEQKLKAQNDDAARKEWEQFRKVYPNYPVKRTLSVRMQSLLEKQ